MNAPLALLKMRFLTGLQYRAAAAAGVLTQFFFGLVFIMVYVAFYRHAGPAQPMTLEEVAAYIWLQQIFFTFIMLWHSDYELFDLITGGGIAYELCRPWRLYTVWYVKLLAARLSACALRCLPIAAVVLFLPEPYGLSLPRRRKRSCCSSRRCSPAFCSSLRFRCSSTFPSSGRCHRSVRYC